MKKAIDFLKGIKPTDDIVIIFNNDADGICSCTLVDKYIEMIGGRKPYIISQPMPMDKNIIRRLQTTLPNKLIFLDLAVDQQQGILKKIGSICDILIIDHHKVYKDLTGKNVVHYNPRFKKNDIYQSTSYLAYKIISEITDISDLLWISGIGMIADYNIEDSKDLVEEIEKKYGIKDLKKSDLGKWSAMISASRATKAISCEQTVNMLKGVKDFSDFGNIEGVGKMEESYKTIENEMAAILQDAEANSEKNGKVIFYEIKSKYNLPSRISTIFSERYPDKLIVIYEKMESKIKVSARNQSNKIDAGASLKRATYDLKASGGGHEAAAGASIKPHDWEKFKEKLIKIVNG